MNRYRLRETTYQKGNGQCVRKYEIQQRHFVFWWRYFLPFDELADAKFAVNLLNTEKVIK
jgi:hypothetical protein